MGCSRTHHEDCYRLSIVKGSGICRDRNASEGLTDSSFCEVEQRSVTPISQRLRANELSVERAYCKPESTFVRVAFKTSLLSPGAFRACCVGGEEAASVLYLGGLCPTSGSATRWSPGRDAEDEGLQYKRVSMISKIPTSQPSSLFAEIDGEGNSSGVTASGVSADFSALVTCPMAPPG